MMPKILERSRLLAARPKNPQRANMLPNIPMEWKIPTYGKQYENSRLEGRSSPQPVNVSARATHQYTSGHSHRFSCRVRVVDDRVKKGEPPFGSLFFSLPNGTQRSLLEVLSTKSGTLPFLNSFMQEPQFDRRRSSKAKSKISGSFDETTKLSV